MYHQQTNMYHQMEQRVEQQREIVQQLRQEASMHRIKVSEAIQDLQNFVMEKQCEDVLLTGFASVKQNPYWKKSKCTCTLT